MREKRAQLEKSPDYIREVLLHGAEVAQKVAQETLKEVRTAMNMVI